MATKVCLKILRIINNNNNIKNTINVIKNNEQ